MLPDRVYEIVSDWEDIRGDGTTVPRERMVRMLDELRDLITTSDTVCGYCGGDVEHREGEGYFHATAGERIDPETISVGDFASLAHNSASRVNPADVITRREYDGER
jgi:hypothetical protein